jgi:hypothetical protein
VSDKPPAYRVIHHLLEALALPLRFRLQQLHDIRIERQGGSHQDIMMPRYLVIKQRQSAAGPPAEPEPREGKELCRGCDVFEFSNLLY